MRVAVLTLTRDRLDYTKHCFSLLHAQEDVDFDHYILDQGSTDGTADWLMRQPFGAGALHNVILADRNMGISRGMNRLLDEAPGYDVYVKFDNDCELVEPDTLARILHIQTDEWILSPRVLGLRYPQHPQEYTMVGGETVGVLPMVGGIFMAVPATVYEGFRYDEKNPVWGMDDNEICQRHNRRGGRCGYVMSLTVNHHETTAGQWKRYPEYFATKRKEGLPG